VKDDDRFYRERERPIEQVLAWGTLHSADFEEKLLEFRISGDMPTITRGRYAIIGAEKLRMLVMEANLWREKAKQVQA
jgi:hypothetical protein